MKSIPCAESPSEPTPNQLRTTSSSAIVAPPSIVTVVCFTGAAGSPLPALNVTMYFVDCGETFAMRTSLCHCDAPARCPADGITNEPAAAPNGDGVTGVTRLTLTGIDVACETSVCARGRGGEDGDVRARPPSVDESRGVDGDRDRDAFRRHDADARRYGDPRFVARRDERHELSRHAGDEERERDLLRAARRRVDADVAKILRIG